MTGGVSVSGGCGRCCWSHTELFTVPFGWGTFRSVVDLEEAVDDLACPTIEHEYRFEKINLRQGMMGAPIDLPMRADNSLWHQVQLISPFWMAKTEVTQELYSDVMNVPIRGEEHFGLSVKLRGKKPLSFAIGSVRLRDLKPVIR